MEEEGKCLLVYLSGLSSSFFAVDGSTEVGFRSKFNFVDLAGSEKLKKTGFDATPFWLPILSS
jgi:hypothetical protein